MTSVHSLSVYFFSVYTRSNPLEHGGPWSSNFWRRQRHPLSTTLPTHNFPSPGRLPTSLRNAWREGAGVNSRTFTIPPPGGGGRLLGHVVCPHYLGVHFLHVDEPNAKHSDSDPEHSGTQVRRFGIKMPRQPNPTEASSSGARRCCRSLRLSL